MTENAPKRLRALTVRPPWSYFIVECKAGTPSCKWIENRHRKPPQHLLGTRVVIHAGRSYDLDGAASIEREHGLLVPYAIRCSPGCAVGVATLAGWVTASDGMVIPPRGDAPPPGWAEDVLTAARNSRWFRGPVGWIFRDHAPLARPVSVRGNIVVGWVLPERANLAVLNQIAFMGPP